MKKAKYSIIFNKGNRLTKTGQAPIHIEIYIDRKNRKHFFSGIYIYPKEWDKKNRLINSNNVNYIQLNKSLKSLINKIEDFELKQLNSGNIFNLDMIEDIMKNNENRESFLLFYENELEKSATVWNYKRHQKTTLNYLRKFKSDVYFSDLNYEFICNFDAYLRTIETNGKKMCVNTIANHHKNIKTMLNIAIKKELFQLQYYPYTKFKVKKEKTKRISLNMEELAKIENIILPDSTFKAVRDMFLFSCYCGLRFSDVVGLKKSEIQKTQKGYLIDIEKMKKTDKPLNTAIPLYLLFDGKPEKILIEYIEQSNNDKIFKKITNEHANRILKSLGIIAGIKKILTFHISRHTFGSYLADKTHDPYLIKDLMGHENIKTSMDYIHSSQEILDNKLKNIKW